MKRKYPLGFPATPMQPGQTIVVWATPRFDFDLHRIIVAEHHEHIMLKAAFLAGDDERNLLDAPVPADKLTPQSLGVRFRLLVPAMAKLCLSFAIAKDAPPGTLFVAAIGEGEAGVAEEVIPEDTARRAVAQVRSDRGREN